MGRVLLVFVFTLFSLSLTAQDYLPEGWDKIMIDDKPAYMNINTGEISYKYPKGVARRKVNNYSSSYNDVSLASGETHTIKSGETLSIIARKYGMNLRDILDLNPSIDHNNLAIGQRIKVAKGSGGVGNGFHTVKTGETLYRISKQHGVSIKKLIMLNRLKSNNIFVGQKLRLE